MISRIKINTYINPLDIAKDKVISLLNPICCVTNEETIAEETIEESFFVSFFTRVVLWETQEIEWRRAYL